jgi:hypothetical protein
LSFNCLAGMWYFRKKMFEQSNKQPLFNQAPSAICFNVLHINFHMQRCLYFSSERLAYIIKQTSL